ncbi:acyltransferase family protein [Vibrio sp. 1CM8B]|uniref:acyltransferase family protein n=1 Tax=Vibrio sp. 1CM8B TaxID=2929167 RepID=UPI0020C0564C|nr:acyltransferase family protein [Vibrio sp. 1CM8B]MCK8087073.1 acyltransferase family protein [Vibrio sp. 1CM8B]
MEFPNKDIMRDCTIDIYRGLCLSLVVLGHSPYLPVDIRQVIYSFHMPAFFILSGYLFKNNGRKTQNYIYSRFRRLVIPAWTFGIICSVPFIAASLTGFYSITTQVLLDKLYGTLTGYPLLVGNFYTTPLWFLFCLFIVECISFTVNNILPRYFYITLLFIGVIGIILTKVDIPITPFNVPIALVAINYYLLGIIIKKLDLSFTIKRAAIFILPLLMCYGYFYEFSTKTIDISQRELGDPVFIGLVLSCLGSFIVLAISKLLSYWSGLYVIYWVKWFGINSIVVIGFDYLTNLVLLTAFNIVGFEVGYTIIFVSRLLLLSLLIYMISKIKILDYLINNGKMG